MEQAQGGDGGYSNLDAAGSGGDAVAKLTTADSSSATLTQYAIAGGGNAGNGVTAGDGGNAEAFSSVSSTVAGADILSSAEATGGFGIAGSGKASAVATASATAKGAAAVAAAEAKGGNGNEASGHASAQGDVAAAAELVLTGGYGARQYAKNDVTGVTNGGSLTLNQFVTGGAGGGAANSVLDFNDQTANATPSSSITTEVTATGGAGAQNADGSGAGGAASAAGTIIGSGVTVSYVDAYGGSSAGNAGANASALSDATGSRADAFATAVGGKGEDRGGNASAMALGNGPYGGADALAETSTTSAAQPFSAIYGATAEAETESETPTVTIASADLRYGNTAFAFISSNQAISNALLAPSASSSAVHGVLDANAAISSAFGARSVFYSVGEVGGHSTDGTAEAGSDAKFSLVLNQSKIAPGGSLVVGLYGGHVEGTGVTSVDLTVAVAGETEKALSFSGDTANQALAAFNDVAASLGSVAGTGTVYVTFELSVTTDVANSGFYGGFIVGDQSGSGTTLQDTRDPYWLRTALEGLHRTAS